MGPIPGPYTCHVNEEVMLSRDFVLNFTARPVWGMRDPILESSPDCKRAASVYIDTNVTRLQSVLETKWGRLILRSAQPD